MRHVDQETTPKATGHIILKGLRPFFQACRLNGYQKVSFEMFLFCFVGSYVLFISTLRKYSRHKSVRDCLLLMVESEIMVNLDNGENKLHFGTKW